MSRVAAIHNPHLVSRMARRAMPNEPASLTPAELTNDDLLRFENLERYRVQSENTKDGEVAPLPERQPLNLIKD